MISGRSASGPAVLVDQLDRVTEADPNDRSEPVPGRLDDRIDDVLWRCPCRTAAGARSARSARDPAGGRSGMQIHRRSVHRPPTSDVRPAPVHGHGRARCLDASGRAASPGRVGAVRLRQHDLQLRGRVGRDRALAHRRPRSGARDGSCCCSVAVAVSVGLNALVSPILGALCPTAAGGGCRSCCSSPACASSPTSVIGPCRRWSALILFIGRQLRLPGGADLLRRDAQDRQPTRRAAAACPASGRRSATAGRSSSALLIFFLDVPVADSASCSRRAVPDLRDPDLR